VPETCPTNPNHAIIKLLFLKFVTVFLYPKTCYSLITTEIKLLIMFLRTTGLSDVPGEAMVKSYCPKCMDVYTPKSSRHHHTDGAYFGTGFPQMLFMVHPEYRPKRPANQFVPRLVYTFYSVKSIVCIWTYDVLTLGVFISIPWTCCKCVISADEDTSVFPVCFCGLLQLPVLLIFKETPVLQSFCSFVIHIFTAISRAAYTKSFEIQNLKFKI
jgi:hypothetical protein